MATAAPTVEEVLGLRFERLSLAARIGLACGLAALWLMARRYAGIVHDATLYLAQGLRRLDPGALDRDLFFAHGSQDAYTLFPLLYAPLIDALGTSGAAMLMTLLGQAAFVAAAVALALRLGDGLARWWSLALLAVVSGFYGGAGVFRFAEPFATARSLAEPLVVGALALSLGGRHALAWIALAAAALLHPIVAAPGFAVLYLWHAALRPRLFWLVPLLLAGAAGVALAWPAATLRFDDPWREAVILRSRHLFLDQWFWVDFARFAWGVLVIGLAARFLRESVLRLALAAVAAACLGLCATGIGVDMLDSALVAALQPWRAHWLMHLLAILLVPYAVAGLWRSGNGGRVAAACVIASCCFGRAELVASAALAVLAVALDLAERRRAGWMGEGLLRLALLAAVCAGSVGLLFEIQSRLPLDYAAYAPSWSDYVNILSSVGGLLPAAGVLCIVACSRLPRAGLALGVAALAGAVATWDARGPWSRFMESAARGEHPFASHIARGATVFWPEPGSPAWQALRTPTWFSVDQGAGIVFHRETAIVYSERREASLELRAGMQNCLYVDRLGCKIKTDYARKMCARRDAPDYLVLNGQVDPAPAVEWRLPPELGFGRKALYLYACRDIRALGSREKAPKEKAGARPAFSVAALAAYSARQSV